MVSRSKEIPVCLPGNVRSGSRCNTTDRAIERAGRLDAARDYFRRDCRDQVGNKLREGEEAEYERQHHRKTSPGNSLLPSSGRDGMCWAKDDG